MFVPSLGELSLVDTRQVPELIGAGYRDAFPELDRLKQDWST